MSNSLRVRCTGSRRSAHPPDGRADAGNQLARTEGLGHVIVRAQLQRLHLVFLLVANGEDQHRQPGREGADAAQRLDAPDSRHIHIQQHRVEDAAAQRLQRLLAARGLHHLKAQLDQRRAQRPADRRFIVHHKNANGRLIHFVDSFCAAAGMAAKNVVPLISSLVTQT